ncbi:MAG: hypothetical protein J5I98_07405 [Phaeodactylibacter sp.]|nr:hypothetical protein [Phaeodactylibacter sp.]
MENTKTHFYASLLFNIALIAAAFQFKEFQMAQLGCLLFFPLWVALSKISKNPRVELAFGRWFPVVGAAILAFVVSIPYWNEAEAIRFFRRENLPSFGLLLMMFFAGYVGVYFAFSEKENWWNRWALAISCFILWWWLFQAVPSRYEAASWILAPFVVVPLFWRLAGLFPEKRFEALLNSNETLPESNLLRILYNDDMPRELRRKALDEIRSDEVLYRLYLDENLEDKLARAALEKIGSEAILKQVIEDEEEEEKTRLACLEKISDESVLSEILHKTQSRAIRRADPRKKRKTAKASTTTPAAERKFIADSRLQPNRHGRGGAPAETGCCQRRKDQPALGHGALLVHPAER